MPAPYRSVSAALGVVFELKRAPGRERALYRDLSSGFEEGNSSSIESYTLTLGPAWKMMRTDPSFPSRPFYYGSAEIAFFLNGKNHVRTE